jgi:TRAP transporter TAXI family solute receptor
MSIESLEHMVRNRVRMFLRHTWLVSILGTLILGSAVWTAFYLTTEPTVVRLAAGAEGSDNAKFAQLLTQKFAQDRDKIRLQFIATAGPKESAQAMTNGSADLAILPSTVGNSPDWPVVAILRQNVMALIVPAPSAVTVKKGKGAKADKLEKVPQLSGRRVGIVTGSEATTDLLNVVLSHYGVPLGKVTISLLDPKNIADAIHANQVDAIFFAGSPTGHAITNAVTAASHNADAPTFIAIDQADGIAKRNPAFDSIDIDAGTFGGTPPSPDDSLKSLSFGEYLVARKSFNHDSIATLARVIYSSRLALAAELPGEVKITAPSTDKDGAVVVHPGALAYLSDSQQSFFDKYGDDIFYGMLIFPVFGSAIAGVASYFRRDTRTRRLRLLQRVLDLVRKAHAAQTLEAIEQLQVEADSLVVAIIHLSEHEEFDETVRMSFSFALEHLRFTIAARRTAILDRIGGAGKAAAA